MRADPKEKDHSFAGWERERWDTEEGWCWAEGTSYARTTLREKRHGLLNPSKEARVSSEQGKSGETQRLKKSRSMSMESKQKADHRGSKKWRVVGARTACLTLRALGGQRGSCDGRLGRVACAVKHPSDTPVGV